MSTEINTGSDGDATLPCGYQVHEFQIERVLGEGGFGIVYLARDLQLQRTVALKEYMPGSLAMRQPGNVVGVRSERHRETFDLGLRSFINEARLLASFDNASLVKVYRFWEQNGTAYMVMPFYEGPTLKAWLKAQAHPPEEAWLKQLLGPLLDALELIHADHCYHRDIAPDNILLLGAQQRPLLLDFGAARRVIGDATQALTVILKPGYAPIEQYAEVPGMKQGPWTDVYALCAVLHMAITGRAPTPAVGRMLSDDRVPLVTSELGRYSPAFLAAIDAGLAVRPEQRPQDIAALRAQLFAHELAVDLATGDATVMRMVDSEATVIAAPSGVGATLARAQPALQSSGTAVVARLQASEPVRLQPPPMPATPVASARAGKGSFLLIGVTGLVVASLAVWYFTRDDGASVDATDAKSAVIAKLEPPPIPTPTPAVVAAPPRAAFTVIAGLEDIVRHSDPLISVNTFADKERIVIGADRMEFRVKSSEAGHLYVFLVGTDNSHLQLLFPNALDQSNRIAADTTVTLPRKGWQITAGGPPGVNHIVAMVSRAPRDFSAAGLKTGETIPEFDLKEAQRVWAATPSTTAAFAGETRCAAGTLCDAGYGATLIRIEEVAAGDRASSGSTVPTPTAGSKPAAPTASLSARCTALRERLASGETLSSQAQSFLREECQK